VPDPVRDALADLDARIAAHDLPIWIGAEPTFTRRESVEPWWLWEAVGPAAGEKLARAEAVAAALVRRLGGGFEAVPGRQYADEASPRFAIAVRWPRDPADGPGALTITPDPGVVEINAAPCASGAGFLDHARAVYAAATEAGLSPLRWRYHGEVVDSGGGGQITLGGPSPEASPFFRRPTLLPRLIRYLNDHPALSYWFLGEHAGAACQSPRADEGVRERWEELQLACATLERLPAAGAELLWATLAPLLVDAAGNSHRAELNVEKLWNAHLGQGRGLMGCVELRAFRMPPSPEMLAAAAALVRAVAARCAIAPAPDAATPRDWGGELHDRMSLPSQLRADLDLVLADLVAHGLGLGDALIAQLIAFRGEPLWTGAVGTATVTLSRALEFWPLLGDVASQERATSRAVDASTERLELVCDAPAAIVVAGRTISLHPDGTRHVLGLRRRVYAPKQGLHAALRPLDPLELRVLAAGAAVDLRIHGWKPGGGAYDALPADAAEAARRRGERVIASAPQAAAAPPAAPPPRWTLDLRDFVLEESSPP